MKLHFSTYVLIVALVTVWVLVAVPLCDGLFTQIEMFAPDGERSAIGYFDCDRSGWPFAHFETADFRGFELRDWTVPLTAEGTRNQLQRACHDLRTNNVQERRMGPLLGTVYIGGMEWQFLQNPNFGPLWLKTKAWKLTAHEYSKVLWLGFLANACILILLTLMTCALYEYYLRTRSSRRFSLRELIVVVTLICVVAGYWGNARRLQRQVDPDKLNSIELVMHAPNWLVRLVGTKPLSAFLRPIRHRTNG